MTVACPAAPSPTTSYMRLLGATTVGRASVFPPPFPPIFTHFHAGIGKDYDKELDAGRCGLGSDGGCGCV